MARVSILKSVQAEQNDLIIYEINKLGVFAHKSITFVVYALYRTLFISKRAVPNCPVTVPNCL